MAWVHWVYNEGEFSYLTDSYRWKREHYRGEKQYYSDWLLKLLCMGVITPEDYETEDANIYNIPRCCVKWYVFLRYRLGIRNAYQWNDYIYGAAAEEYEYVRCPKCIKEDEQ